MTGQLRHLEGVRDVSGCGALHRLIAKMSLEEGHANELREPGTLLLRAFDCFDSPVFFHGDDNVPE